MGKRQSRPVGMRDEDYHGYMILSRMFACWVQNRMLRKDEEVPKHVINGLLKDKDRFSSFHDHLERALNYYDANEDENSEDPRPASRKPCFACSPTLAARQADISLATKTGHFNLLRTVGMFTNDVPPQVSVCKLLVRYSA